MSHNTLVAAFWMLGTISSFSLMAIGGRELSAHLDTAQILLFRGLVSFIIISLILCWRGWSQVRTQDFSIHAVRNLTHFLGQYGWFYGIAFIPLAEVFAIEFTVPIWTAIVAAFLLKESITKAKLQAVMLGLIGVIIILRPGIEIVSVAALAVLGGAISYGFAHSFTKKLVGKDSPLAILFYMSLIQLPISLVLAYEDWAMPTDGDWVWLILVGVTALTAHYSMARALILSDVTVVVPMDFLRLPLIMLVGFLFYQEQVDWVVLLGAGIMLLGNLVNLRVASTSESKKSSSIISD